MWFIGGCHVFKRDVLWLLVALRCKHARISYLTSAVVLLLGSLQLMSARVGLYNTCPSYDIFFYNVLGVGTTEEDKCRNVHVLHAKIGYVYYTNYVTYTRT